MSPQTAVHPEAAEPVSKTIAGPKGTKFTAVTHGNSTTLTSANDPNQTIVVNLPPPGSGTKTIDVSVSGIIDTIGNGLLEVLGALKKVLSCTPTTKTTVNVGSNGQVTSIVTETTCTAS
jgi:hypothetical protein